MNDSALLFLLLAVIFVPALFIGRSAKRLGSSARRVERLEVWAAPRGWQVRGEDDTLVGTWQCPPFTAAERSVADGLVGGHGGRAATSLRLDADGAVYHVFTVELREPLPVVQVMTDGVPQPDLGAGGAWLADRAPVGLSLRVERGVLVGWLPGEPLHTELDRYLELLTEVADRLEALYRPD